jgi:hypothetical protein
VGFHARLFHRSHDRSNQGKSGRIVEIVAPTADASIPRLHDNFVIDELADAARTNIPPGLADVRAAVAMVASGEARSVVLNGFPDSLTLMRLGRELASDGVAIEPLIRSGGGAFDIRVHRPPASDP